ncbi:hypothetical protein TRIUR3_07058 [Triticum urartu]|uniref:At4g15545-like C-terminal domain-containing protein n=2 Tax=Triticum TaxID=4564 RepID=A0A9R1P2P1_TRITD|nr:hypothetical protein TRIUR3_07058 [Triticum urartu]VAH35598.1 unnamed protein product [Triticum turgidum subsp. durum]
MGDLKADKKRNDGSSSQQSNGLDEQEEYIFVENGRATVPKDNQQAKLVKERDTLALTAKKLSRNLAKLEAFKKQLMKSLSEDNLLQLSETGEDRDVDAENSGTARSPSWKGRPRIDGKEFFRQARTRLSYEQFGAFLANIKEFNAQKQSREDTLSKAEEIFGTEHKDLYISFQNMLNRNQS